MLSAYPACFFKEKSGYSVIFPDLEFLSTCGKTFEEALTMAVDCLAGYLFELDIDKTSVPAPSTIQQISIDAVAKELGEDFIYDEAFVNIVTVDVESYAKTHFCKSIKKTLSIPEWLNRQALAAGINFSQVLQEALIQKLRMK